MNKLMRFHSDKSHRPAGIVSGKPWERLKGLEYLGSRRKAKENLGRLLAGRRVWISRQGCGWRRAE